MAEHGAHRLALHVERLMAKGVLSVDAHGGPEGDDESERINARMAPAESGGITSYAAWRFCSRLRLLLAGEGQVQGT